MKRFFAFLLLALAGGTTPSFAQSEVPMPYPSPYIPAPGSRAEFLFNSPAPGTLQHQFTFGLGGGNTMRIELTYVGQLLQLNDLDSLFRSVWNGLQPFYDTLRKPLVSRRIDYRIGGPGDVQVRFLEYPQSGDVFRIHNGDTSQVKVEQDSLRIIQFTYDSSLLNRRNASFGRTTPEAARQAYVITLVLNNISDLPRLSAADLHWALIHLKEELGRNLYAAPEKQFLSRFSAAYDVTTRRKVTPYKFRPLNSTTLSPYVQVGIQFARGNWLPSAGLGLEFSDRRTETETRNYRFFWEPYFTFGHDVNGAVTVERNDFLTLQYGVNFRRLGSKTPTFTQSFSLGYLRHRRGNTFEENTIKFTLPGLQAKNLSLEPEFYFNNFFKNFSPSLKLTLNLE